MESALCLWNLNTCIKKVNAKCWLVEMTVTTSLPLACVFQCLFTLILHSFLLRLDWWKCDSSVDGEPQGNWRSVEFKFQRCICKLSFLFPPCPAPESLLTGYPHKREMDWEEHKHCFPPPPIPNPCFLKFSKWNVWFCYVNGKHCWQLENLVTTIGFGPQI